MDLSNFQQTDTDDVVSFIARPQLKAISDLERVVALGKPNKVLESFAALVAQGELWAWWDRYIDNCHDTALVMDFNMYKAWKVISEDEEGVKTLVKQKELPAEIRPCPELRTTEQVLAPYMRDMFKKDRQAQVDALTVEVDAMVFDGDEPSQDRMVRAITALALSADTTLWGLADNTVKSVTKTQLKSALKLAGQAQTDIWFQV